MIVFFFKVVWGGEGVSYQDVVFDNNIAWNLNLPLLINHMQLRPGSIDQNCIVLLTIKYCIFILMMDLFNLQKFDFLLWLGSLK